MIKCDVAIIGGGLVGCATAYYLSRQGVSVVLVEQGQLNQGASGQNAGSLHFQLEHRLFGDDEQHTRDFSDYVTFTKVAIESWRNIEKELGCDLQLTMEGGLVVAESAAQVSMLERKFEIEHGAGLTVEMLDGDAARRAEPCLGRQVVAAQLCPYEGHCNPRLVTPAYATRAREQGAQLLTRSRVSTIRPLGGRWRIAGARPAVAGREGTFLIETDRVVNAAGAWAGEVAALANLHLPITPVGLTLNATEPVAPIMHHLIQHASEKLTLKQVHDGNVLIGGGWSARLEQDRGHWRIGRSPRIRMDSITGNLQAAVNIVPALAELHLLRSWTGTTGLTPDQYPVLGEVPEAPRFYVAAGSSGFTFGPAYAQILTELIVTGGSAHLLAPFSPARFSPLNMFMA